MVAFRDTFEVDIVQYVDSTDNHSSHQLTQNQLDRPHTATECSRVNVTSVLYLIYISTIG